MIPAPVPGPIPISSKMDHAWEKSSPPDSKGETSMKCRITVTKDDGSKTFYIVTARYSEADLNARGFAGKIDDVIQNVVNASLDVFPELAGSTISFNPNTPQNTLITKHNIADFTGKKLEYLKDKDQKLHTHISKISRLFCEQFKILIPPVKVTVEEEKDPAVTLQVEQEQAPAPAPSPAQSIGFQPVVGKDKEELN